MVELLSERLGLFLTLEEVVHLCTAQPSPPPRSRVANRHLLRGGAAPGLEPVSYTHLTLTTILLV